jgi:chromosome partitioning protein
MTQFWAGRGKTMQTITLLNEKGGVGKTTLAVHLAMAAAAKGMRVMLIDADPQGHATLRCGFPKAPKLYDLLVRDAEWDEAAVEVAKSRYAIEGRDAGTLFLVASNVETRNISNSIDNVAKLAMRIEELREDDLVDVVIIDTSPTPSLFHASIYIATDGIIFPTALAFTSFDGLNMGMLHKQGADLGRKSRYSLPPIQLLGIVPIMTRLGTKEQADNLDILKKQYGDSVWADLPLRTLWTETESRALPVWQLDGRSEAAQEFWKVYEYVEGVFNVEAQY